MAFSTTKKTEWIRRGLLRTTWTLVDTAGSSQPEQFPNADQITFQSVYTAGAGTLTVEASNDGATWAVLPTTTLAFTAAGQKTVAAADLGFLHYRITLSGGGGTTDTTVIAVAHVGT